MWYEEIGLLIQFKPCHHLQALLPATSSWPTTNRGPWFIWFHGHLKKKPGTCCSGYGTMTQLQ